MPDIFRIIESIPDRNKHLGPDFGIVDVVAEHIVKRKQNGDFFRGKFDILRRIVGLVYVFVRHIHGKPIEFFRRVDPDDLAVGSCDASRHGSRCGAVIFAIVRICYVIIARTLGIESGFPTVGSIKCLDIAINRMTASDGRSGIDKKAQSGKRRQKNERKRNEPPDSVIDGYLSTHDNSPRLPGRSPRRGRQIPDVFRTAVCLDGFDGKPDLERISGRIIGKIFTGEIRSDQSDFQRRR